MVGAIALGKTRIDAIVLLKTLILFDNSSQVFSRSGGIGDAEDVVKIKE